MWKKTALKLLAIPFLGLISIVLGMPIGFIGKLVGNFEDLVRYIKEDYMLSRHNPEAYNELFNSKMLFTMFQNGSKEEEIRKAMSSLKSGEIHPYHPFFTSLSHIGIFIVLTPFSCLVGLIEGIGRVFEELWEFFCKKILREPFVDKYQKMAEELRLGINSNNAISVSVLQDDNRNE